MSTKHEAESPPPTGTNGHGELRTALSLDDIASADDLPTEWVDVPEWGVRVLMQAMSSEKRDLLEKQSVQSDGESTTFKRDGFRVSVVALCWIHPETKKQVVSGDKDVTRLWKKSNVVIERLYKVGARLSGFGEAEIEQRKNGSPGGGTSPSTSATNSAG